MILKIFLKTQDNSNSPFRLFIVVFCILALLTSSFYIKLSFTRKQEQEEKIEVTAHYSNF